MVDLEFLKKQCIEGKSKIVLLVMDGLGGLPVKDGMTELEASRTPNFDALAKKSSGGLVDPISTGIIPGSGPAHLGLFGYDPLKYEIGRGVLGAVGLGFDITCDDVAIRANFCTVDEKGIVTDRRAGRISTEICTALCKKLSGIKIPGASLFVIPEKEHRAAVIFRAKGLGADVTDSDPQRTGVTPFDVKPLDKKSRKTSEIATAFLNSAGKVLKNEHPANMILLRGFSKYPLLPSMQEVYKLKAAVIAVYPMYRGLAKLVGMDVLRTGETIADEFAVLRDNYGRYDFFFVHIKKTDSYGEDGNFDAKVHVIEEVDSSLPKVLDLNPGVLVVTGDHSTPAVLKSHSWHPNPLLLKSGFCRYGLMKRFTENECANGGLGRLNSLEVMPLAMANAQRISKFGA